jgi:hypothetical protein
VRRVAILIVSFLLSLTLIFATMIVVHRLVLAIYGWPHARRDVIWLVKPR